MPCWAHSSSSDGVASETRASQPAAIGGAMHDDSAPKWPEIKIPCVWFYEDGGSVNFSGDELKMGKAMQYKLDKLISDRERYAESEIFAKRCHYIFGDISHMSACKPQKHLAMVSTRLLWSIGQSTYDSRTGVKEVCSP